MDRDRRFDDQRRGGESYRPFRRSPRPESRPFRSPPRNRSPVRPAADTWAPSNRGRPRSRSPDNFRPRSRSPPFRGRGRGFNFANRHRSPPRGLSPGRDRPPPRFNRRSRSPLGPPLRRSPPPFNRNRSPGLKRGREPSPGAVHPPHAQKRERNNSPLRGRFDRPRSPPFIQNSHPRDGRFGPRKWSRSPDRRPSRVEPYRPLPPRSPSAAALSAPSSGHDSAATSRRSSPPGLDRVARNYPNPSSHASTPGPSRPSYDSGIARESPVSNTPTARPTENIRVSPRIPSSPRRPSASLPSPRSQESPKSNVESEQGSNRSNQTKPIGISRDESKAISASPAPAPAPGPGASDTPTAVSPPLGPSAAPVARPMKMATRGHHAALLSAPTRPKGSSGPAFARDTGPPTGPRESMRASLGPMRRGGSHAPSPHHGHLPTGPRGNSGSPGSDTRPYESNSRSTFRHANSAPANFQRTQRFTNHLSGLPSVIPGGKVLPSVLEPMTDKRLVQLDADREKLLEQISEKQRAKRDSLREWDKLSRESEIGALKTELADGHLQRMSETEGIGGGVAF
ncbi:hypothetical protein FQN57_006804 [Myotisia sp. PD_48]|nr:hypothetical protein FQN57_006804 [Myotisia sp. PD_48]